MREEAEPGNSTKRRRGYRFKVVAGLAGLLMLVVAAIAAESYRNTIEPSGIVIHHSAVPFPPDGTPIDVHALDEIHRRRGFGIFYWGRFYHVGYHYIILPDGAVQPGRPEHCQGAHATGYNSYLGICLIGDFSEGDGSNRGYGPREPTAAQMNSLVNLINTLRKRYTIPLDRVIQHHDVNPETHCPGERFPYPQLIDRLREADLNAP